MIWQFPNYTIGEALNLDCLAMEFSWIEDMKTVKQDKIWHAEGNVFIHTQMVIDMLINLPEFAALTKQDKHILVASALLHDVEKRSTTTIEILDNQERIIAPKHAKLGQFTTRQLLYKDIPTPFFIRESICKLVRLHGLPIWAIDKPDAIKEVIYASQVVNTKHLAMLAKADVLGRICNDQEELLFKIELFEELCKEQDCFGKPKTFASDYGRYLYFHKKECSPDYKPYNDLKFEVQMMSALPGSGKDSYIHRHFDLPILSLDDLRRAHKISPTDKKKNGKIIQFAKERAKELMRQHTSFVFNATNITADMRKKWINLFTTYGGQVNIFYIEVPYQQLIHQNHNREYKVPVAVIDKMLSKLEIPTVREAHKIKYIVEKKG